MTLSESKFGDMTESPLNHLFFTYIFMVLSIVLSEQHVKAVCELRSSMPGKNFLAAVPQPPGESLLLLHFSTRLSQSEEYLVSSTKQENWSRQEATVILKA